MRITFMPDPPMPHFLVKSGDTAAFVRWGA
jgi:hypothetical protein